MKHVERLYTLGQKRKPGRDCAMNKIAKETGEASITDYPRTSDRYLSKLTQMYNDNCCKRSKVTGKLCKMHSFKAMRLAQKTKGTMWTATFSDYYQLAEAASSKKKIIESEIKTIDRARRHVLEFLHDPKNVESAVSGYLDGITCRDAKPAANKIIDRIIREVGDRPTYPLEVWAYAWAIAHTVYSDGTIGASVIASHDINQMNVKQVLNKFEAWFDLTGFNLDECRVELPPEQFKQALFPKPQLQLIEGAR